MTVKAYNAYIEGDKAISAHFTVNEFRCHDGSGALLISDELVQLLEKIREHFKKPVTVNSGYRNQTYNAKQGSSDGSQHCQGTAADIQIAGVKPREIAEYAETLIPTSGGIGLYEYTAGGFTHIDVREKRARWLRKTPNGADTAVDKFGTVAPAVEKYPQTRLINGMPGIIANEIKVIASPGKGLSAFSNSMNGGFYMLQRVGGGVPISICISDGAVKRATACHASDGFPESVIYKTKSGSIGITRIRNVSELPVPPTSIQWAVGGLGLLDKYAPEKEGFCRTASGDYSDVLRDTDHAMLGVKENRIYMVLCKSMTAAQVDALAKAAGMEIGVMLDGGHIAAINGSESYAKINTGILQYYVLQGI